MEAIILAGGFGTRLRTVVSEVPKPMAPIGEVPFLQLLINFWEKQGITRFILSVGYKHQIIREYFGKEFAGCEIEYVVEDKPLGTGGAVLAAIKYLKTRNSFLIVNGDTYFDVGLEKIKKFHKKKNSTLTMALFAIYESDRYHSVELGSNSQVLSLNANKKGKFANGGILLCSPSIFNNVEGDFSKPIALENDLLASLINKRESKIFGLKDEGIFIDIGIPEDYAKAKHLLPTLI